MPGIEGATLKVVSTEDEAALLTTIAETAPPAVQHRYDELVQKRRDEMLPPHEHAELLELTEQMELRAVRRLEAVAQLARLRGVAPAALLNEFSV
jgi:hypothetical protein